MNADKLNLWLRLLANVGMVVGLFAVLFELRHSSQVAEVAAYQARTSEIQSHNLELAVSEDFGDILAKYKSDGKNNLSPGELIRVRAWYHVILRQMQGQYYQYEKGFLERSVIERSLADLSDGLYEVWDDLGLVGAIENERWRKEIERFLAQQGVGTN